MFHSETDAHSYKAELEREAPLKIQERDPKRIVQLNTQIEEVDADDPYAAYQIPDDLMW